MPEAHKYTKDEVWGMSDRELIRHGVAFVNDILFGDTIDQFNKIHGSKKRKPLSMPEWYNQMRGQQVMPDPAEYASYNGTPGHVTWVDFGGIY